MSSQHLSTVAEQGWIKLNFRCSSTSYELFFKRALWATHVVLGGRVGTWYPWVVNPDLYVLMFAILD